MSSRIDQWRCEIGAPFFVGGGPNAPTDTSGITRVLLIDREGIMQGDLQGTDLAERVGACFEPPAASGG